MINRRPFVRTAYSFQPVRRFADLALPVDSLPLVSLETGRVLRNTAATAAASNSTADQMLAGAFAARCSFARKTSGRAAPVCEFGTDSLPGSGGCDCLLARPIKRSLYDPSETGSGASCEQPARNITRIPPEWPLSRFHRRERSLSLSLSLSIFRTK